MNRFSSFFLIFFVAVGLLVTGCDSTGSSSESGSLELQMSGSSTSTLSTASSKTNASDVTEALVTIGEVSIVPADDTSDGDSTETGVTALSDSNFTVDLKRLQAGIDTAMTEIDIPAGTYSQVRLVTTGPAEVTFQDGSTRDVMIASGQQSGLKVNFEPFTINNADDRAELTINWDVEESLRGAPQGRYVITPVVDASVSVVSAGN